MVQVLHSEEVVKNMVSFLPLVVIAIPAIAAVVTVAIGNRNEKLRNLTCLIAAAGTFGIALAILSQVLGGNPLYCELKLIEVSRGFSLKLMVDSMGAFFALIASILWVAAVAHSSDYMFHESKRTRFFSFLMIAESAIMGVFMAHDFFSLFVFFELMSLAAYFLIVHSETLSAQRAAKKYLIMSLMGSLSLLMGVFLYLSYSGTVDFVPPPGSAHLNGPLSLIALICMIAGFGVKAGIVPLHVWLPDAHPVAPSPASALLSGVIIKVGAYGILRMIASFYYVPVASEAGEHGIVTIINAGNSLSASAQSLGFALILIAMVTMFTGMVLAVIQDDIKRTLAYSSISQIGFILLGVGCLAYLGEEGATGLAGSLYHIMNHAFFKGCLFLVTGSILYRTRELNMFKLRGLWRKMPLTTLLWCVAALGIMGIPLFNGFVSKCMLHHAVAEAQHLASEEALFQAASLKAVEVLYTIICAGTILYTLKMTYYVFFRPRSEESIHHLENVKEAPGWMLGGAGILAVGVLVTGLAPGLFLQRLIIPVAEVFQGLDPHTMEHLAHINIFSWANIKEVLLPLALGVIAFIIGVSSGLFESKRFRLLQSKVPRWLSIDYCYVEGARGFVSVCFVGQKICGEARQAAIDTIKAGTENLCQRVRDKFAPLIREYSGDIALGALVITVSLVLFLALKLFY